MESGALASNRYLIVDRNTKYTQQFRTLIDEGGTEVIRLPPMSPNLNAYAERFVRSVKDECSDHSPNRSFSRNHPKAIACPSRRNDGNGTRGNGVAILRYTGAP